MLITYMYIHVGTHICPLCLFQVHKFCYFHCSFLNPLTIITYMYTNSYSFICMLGQISMSMETSHNITSNLTAMNFTLDSNASVTWQHLPLAFILANFSLLWIFQVYGWDQLAIGRDQHHYLLSWQLLLIDSDARNIKIRTTIWYAILQVH